MALVARRLGPSAMSIARATRCQLSDLGSRRSKHPLPASRRHPPAAADVRREDGRGSRAPRPRRGAHRQGHVQSASSRGAPPRPAPSGRRGSRGAPSRPRLRPTDARHRQSRRGAGTQLLRRRRAAGARGVTHRRRRRDRSPGPRCSRRSLARRLEGGRDLLPRDRIHLGRRPFPPASQRSRLGHGPARRMPARRRRRARDRREARPGRGERALTPAYPCRPGRLVPDRSSELAGARPISPR